MRKPSRYLRNVVRALILAGACLMAGTSVSAADIPSALPSAELPSLPDYGASDTYSRSYGTLPESYDSRKLGLITPVRNQNPWGTCWAFGALGAGEASLIKKGLALWIFPNFICLTFSSIPPQILWATQRKTR